METYVVSLGALLYKFVVRKAYRINVSSNTTSSTLRIDAIGAPVASEVALDLGDDAQPVERDASDRPLG